MALRIYESILQYPFFTRSDVFVFSYLLALREMFGDELFPSESRIAQKVGLSRVHVSKSLKHLVALKMLARRRKKGLRTWCYRIVGKPKLPPNKRRDGYVIVSDDLIAKRDVSLGWRTLYACILRCESIRQSARGNREFTVDEWAEMSGLHWKSVVRLLNHMNDEGWLMLDDPLPLKAESRILPVAYTIGEDAE